jgi:uncharacterized membrane protein YfcA
VDAKARGGHPPPVSGGLAGGLATAAGRGKRGCSWVVVPLALVAHFKFLAHRAPLPAAPLPAAPPPSPLTNPALPAGTPRPTRMVAAGLMLGAWPLSPIIFGLGLHPQVAAGTSKVLLMMIMGGAGLSFLAAGRMNRSYLLAYGLTNMAATPLGVWAFDRLVARRGRPSYITLLTIARLALCVLVQAGFHAGPQLARLAAGLPRAGFMHEPLCGGDDGR